MAHVIQRAELYQDNHPDLTLSALIFILVLYAPNYLNYADPPIKADAIVLFVGPTDFSTPIMQIISLPIFPSRFSKSWISILINMWPSIPAIFDLRNGNWPQREDPPVNRRWDGNHSIPLTSSKAFPGKPGKTGATPFFPPFSHFLK
jgi:hypothetical protein